MKKRLILAFSLILPLMGCSHNAQQSLSSVTTKPSEVEYVQGQLNKESLLDLLTAEFAGHQQQFDSALELYLKQARLTKDAGVAERATHIAQYLQDPDSIFEAANLWIKAAPEQAEPYQIATNVLLHQQRFDEALPLLKQALSSSQSRILNLLDLRAQQIPLETVDGYVTLLRQQLASQPKKADLHRTLGVMLRRQGKLSLAQESLQKAYQLAPKQADIIVQLADLLRAQKQTNKALRLTNKGLKHFPDDKALKLLLVQLNFNKKKSALATEEALKLIENTPSDTQLHLYLALLMLDANKLDASEKVLQQIKIQKPGDSTPNFYLGHIEQRRGHPNKAINYYQQVTNGSKRLQAYSRIAALLDSPADQNQLSEIMSQGRLMYPELAEQLYVLQAEWLQSYSLTDQALALLEGGLNEQPNSVQMLYTRAILQEETNFPLAELDLRKVIELQPNNAQALNALGYSLIIHTKRYNEALALLEKAFSLAPDDAAIEDSLGWVYFKLGDYQRALHHLQHAFASLPEPEIAGHLIQTLFKLGRVAEAKKLLKTTLRQHPDNNYLLDAQKVLNH